MVKTKRTYLKRKLAQARNDIDRALGKIVDLHEMFESVHPQHAELLEVIAKGLLLQRGLLERFWEISWGSLPKDWDSYIGDGRKRGKNG